MTRADKKILHEIQKNARMGIESIQTVSEKIYDEGLALDLNKHILKYHDFKNRAEIMLQEAKQPSYSDNMIKKGMLRTAIHMNTVMDKSTSHVAELMIQENNKGILGLYRAINHNETAGKYAVEMAKELMGFEEKAINRLKEYL